MGAAEVVHRKQTVETLPTPLNHQRETLPFDRRLNGTTCPDAVRMTTRKERWRVVSHVKQERDMLTGLDKHGLGVLNMLFVSRYLVTSRCQDANVSHHPCPNWFRLAYVPNCIDTSAGLTSNTCSNDENGKGGAVAMFVPSSHIRLSWPAPDWV